MSRNKTDEIAEKPKKDHRLQLRLPSDLVEKARQEAKRQNRSLANYIETLLVRELGN